MFSITTGFRWVAPKLITSIIAFDVVANMKIDGTHPVRQQCREQIRYVKAHGSITLTEAEFCAMISKIEQVVPRPRQHTSSWKGNR